MFANALGVAMVASHASNFSARESYQFKSGPGQLFALAALQTSN